MTSQFQIPRHVNDAFLVPLLAVFGEPSTPDPERTLAEYARYLKGYAGAELDRAAGHLARSHKGPARWPKLAECIDACNDAREALAVKARDASPRASTDNYRARADNAERLMMSTELGQEAARDGWANGCRDFISAKGRLPQEHEVHDLKRNAEFIDRCAAGTIHMGVIHGALQGLAGQLVQRRHDIADRVLSGEVRERT